MLRMLSSWLGCGGGLLLGRPPGSYAFRLDIIHLSGSRRLESGSGSADKWQPPWGSDSSTFRLDVSTFEGQGGRFQWVSEGSRDKNGSG